MAPEYLKGSARVLWLRRINFGQCLGAYVHSDGLKGPYLYRFDEHPKSYRLPTIVKLTIFFYPSKGHRSKVSYVDQAGERLKRSSKKAAITMLSAPHDKPDHEGSAPSAAF
jgi:hypothetical protein